MEVVENGGGADEALFIDIGVSVLEDDDVGILRAIILGRHVKVILAEGAFKDLSLPVVAGDLALGNVGLGQGIGGELVCFGREGGDEEEGGKEGFEHGRSHIEILANVKVM